LIQTRGKGGDIHGSKVNKAKDSGRYRLNHGRIYEPDSIVFPRQRLRCQQFLRNDGGSVVFRIHCFFAVQCNAMM
jgi:hypothetical protein